MKSITIAINISQEQYLSWYQGTVSQVQALDEAGKTIRFPAKILQPYVSHDGVQGRFQISFDQENRFRKIIKL